MAVFLDYDGTLTPIVETPEQAVHAGRDPRGGG
jgi:trehalose-6-phosphatase